MRTRTHKFQLDITSTLVFVVSVGIGLYIAYELIAAYIRLF
ncbi:MAG: hypothetical protein PVG89_02545 [Gammaproteobacteria bacterium]|jgi:hypothetical protein